MPMASPFSFVREEDHAEMTEVGQAVLGQRMEEMTRMFADLQAQLNALRGEAGNAVGSLEARFKQEVESKLQQAEKQAMRIASIKPPKPDRFKGTDKGPRIHEWLHQAETYLRAAGLQEEEQGVWHITAFLESDAAVWWRHYCSRVDKGEVAQPGMWRDLRQLLLDQFQVFNHETDIRDQYTALRQTGSVANYIARFRALVIELTDEREEARIYQFLKGLKPEIQARTRTHKPKTLAVAMDIADQADRAHSHAYKGIGRRGERPPDANDPAHTQPLVEDTTEADIGPEPMDLNAVRQGGADRRWTRS